MFEKGITVPLEGWSVVECGMYLAAACLPLLRPVLGQVIPQVKLDHSLRKNRASSSIANVTIANVTIAKLQGAHDENSGCLEMGHTATFVNEVNGRSATCQLVHPEGIKATCNEISVSVTHSPIAEDGGC